MPTIERDGASVYYEVSGEGPAVLLGHSLLCDGRMWEGVVPRLSDHFRVINTDFRGHRRSRATRHHTLEELAADWSAIMDQEGIDEAALCGLSMGGMVAMRLALARPDRVNAIVALDSNGAREARFNRFKYWMMARVYRRFGIKPVEGAVLKLMFGRTTLKQKRAIIDRFRERAREHEREGLYYAVNAVFRRGSIVDQLDAIRCPVLIMVGDEDKATPLDRSQELHRAIPGSVLEIVPRAGHLSAMEQPELISERVIDFLSGTAATHGQPTASSAPG